MKVLLEISANYEELVKVGQTGSGFQINETEQFVKKEKCGFFALLFAVSFANAYQKKEARLPCNKNYGNHHRVKTYPSLSCLVPKKKKP